MPVILDAGRACAEDKGVLPIVKSIKQDLYRVGVGEAAVAPILTDDNILRLGIKTDDSDIDVAAVISKADFGFFRSGGSLVRLLLDETFGRLNLLPDRLTDQPVYHRRRSDALCAYSFPSFLPLLSNNVPLSRSDINSPETISETH